MDNENIYFVSREQSMGDKPAPGRERLGNQSVKTTDRKWTLYKWVDRKTKTAVVVRHGYTLKGGRIKASQLNRGLEIED